MRKPDFGICENKDADQLRGDSEADQRLCFRYTDSIIPLLPISEISSLWSSSVAVQPGLCRTWSETPKTGFLNTRLILSTHTLLQFDLTQSFQASLLSFWSLWIGSEIDMCLLTVWPLRSLEFEFSLILKEVSFFEKLFYITYKFETS